MCVWVDGEALPIKSYDDEVLLWPLRLFDDFLGWRPMMAMNICLVCKVLCDE